jgi:phosphoglycolate phosphatase-like HAD superfamily hydrolase
MKNNLYLIFNFDGTLVDSFRAMMEKFNPLTDEFNFRKLNENEIDDLRDLTSIKFIQYLETPFIRFLVYCVLQESIYPLLLRMRNDVQ